MEHLKRYSVGGHTQREMHWHLAILSVGFWGLVLCAWLGYPSVNRYSIMRETLSALGSFEAGCNPKWFWVFSVAMVYCGLLMIPVSLYVRRRILGISVLGATVGAVFFLAGSFAIIAVGLFPYAHSNVLGWDLADVHVSAAGLIGAFFSIGVVWHAILLLKDARTERSFVQKGARSYLSCTGPFLVCFVVMAFVGYNVRWQHIQEAFAALGRASGEEAIAKMSSAFARFGSFPIMEHIAIWTLTIFTVWFTAILPCPAEAGQDRRGGRQDPPAAGCCN